MVKTLQTMKQQKTYTLPQPILIERPINEMAMENLLHQGEEQWFAKILATRIDESFELSKLSSFELKNLPDPIAIPDMEKAVNRIVKAIQNNERIVFACDHDMDGTASAALLWSAFVDIFGVDKDLLTVVTSHRLTEGYGITEPVVARIIDLKPTLVITADKGSSDEVRINKLSEAGIDVIVTDHHELGEYGPPPSAYAVVNPIRQDSTYDKFVCGAGVAFLTMAKVRTALIESGFKTEIGSLLSLMDYVAVATVADCVSMNPVKSLTNRTFVKRGLELINRKSKPCWTVFCSEQNGPVDAETIGFKLAPAIAAAGRLDWAVAGFKFLISDSVEVATEHWELLKSENEERKSIEKSLRERAFSIASQLSGHSIIIYLEDGHSGVHGITASRLVEAFGKASGVFSPRVVKKNELMELSKEIASGSFRGVPGLHVRDALADVDKLHPGLLLGFGGHQGAAGASIKISDIEDFAYAYNNAVIKQLGNKELKPIIEIDGEIPLGAITLKTLEKIESLEPWGREFPSPTFKGTFQILNIKLMSEGLHCRLSLKIGQGAVEAIWFNVKDVDGFESLVKVGNKIQLIYKLKSNWYQNRKTLQLQVVTMIR